MRFNRMAVASWTVLAYTILVILWGAFVRATGSGAGCGNHWPLCNGAVIPRPEQVETVIEFTHRAMTGVLVPFAVLVVVWILRRLDRNHPARKAGIWSLIFLLVESLIGAGLVRFELVADDASAARPAGPVSAQSARSRRICTTVRLIIIPVQAKAPLLRCPTNANPPTPSGPWLVVGEDGQRIPG